MAGIEYRAFLGGRPIRSTVAAAWTAFLNGHWTRERPRHPGKYMVAGKSRRVLGEVLVFWDAESKELAVRIRDSALCAMRELDEEALWWWSAPMPQLLPMAVPVGGRRVAAPAAKPKPVAPARNAEEERERKDRARRYEKEKRRELMKQIGLHEMPKWKDER